MIHRAPVPGNGHVVHEEVLVGQPTQLSGHAGRAVARRADAAQSAERDPEKRKKIAWEIDKKLTNEAVRPMLYYMYGATCWQPGLKGVNVQVNSIYNNWRLDDVWLE